VTYFFELFFCSFLNLLLYPLLVHNSFTIGYTVFALLFRKQLRTEGSKVAWDIDSQPMINKLVKNPPGGKKSEDQAMELNQDPAAKSVQVAFLEDGTVGCRNM
jgi:hypothetical protein